MEVIGNGTGIDDEPAGQSNAGAAFGGIKGLHTPVECLTLGSHGLASRSVSICLHLTVAGVGPYGLTLLLQGMDIYILTLLLQGLCHIFSPYYYRGWSIIYSCYSEQGLNLPSETTPLFVHRLAYNILFLFAQHNN